MFQTVNTQSLTMRCLGSAITFILAVLLMNTVAKLYDHVPDSGHTIV